jgi:hypothetical protein
MSELTAAGYQTFRDYLYSAGASQPDWDYIEVYDDSGSAVTRVSITGDSRCQWLDIDGDNVLEVEFVITGSDSDIPLPTTIKQSALWNDTSANSGTQVTQKETFAQATLNQTGDKLTITHTIKVPQ